MEEYRLTALVGFLFDTTLAAAHLVFAGVMERNPQIAWMLTHMGGVLPYLAERCDRGYEAFADCRRNISKPPSEDFKQFYYDTVNFNPDAINFAIAFAGADHIVAGSDYPHQIGSIPKMLDAIGKIDVTDETAADDPWRQCRASAWRAHLKQPQRHRDTDQDLVIAGSGRLPDVIHQMTRARSVQ